MAPADPLQPLAPWAGPLTPPELVVLALLSAGYAPDDLTGLLRTTPQRVSAHLEAAAARLGVASWDEAVRAARRRGLIA